MHGIVIVAALLYFCWVFLKQSGDTPSALRESRATYWQKPDLARLRSIAKKLDDLKAEIEEKVGLDGSMGEAASIEEGLVEWEDCVEPGFEREKKLWWEVKKEYDRIQMQISALERARQ